MKFAMKGLVKGQKLETFHQEWFRFTAHENRILFGRDFVSPAQVLVMDLFCGVDEPYENSGEMVISTTEPAQAELEALIRARGRALAAAMHRGDLNTEGMARAVGH